MSTKHTPGPWTIGRPSEYGTHNANHIFAGGDGIANVYGIAMHTTLEEAAKMPRSAEGLANARLIAKAPDMLDMLIQCRKEFAGLPHSLGYDFTHLPKLDALIAEAAGEQA